VNFHPTSYFELSQRWQEGRDYRIHIHRHASHMVVFAPHGGGIEPGTSEIARELAGGYFSLYCFEGLRNTDNWRMHLSSRLFDEMGCLELLKRHERAVAVHGCRDQEQTVFVGGLDQHLKQQVLEALLRGGYDAREDFSHHSGRDSLSLCNRALSGKGLQLELSLGFRKTLFIGLKQEDRTVKTPFFEQFTATIRQVLLDVVLEKERKPSNSSSIIFSS
jgi:phage replication-related protein YjqB (UPF0714/DUF867 family)